MSMRVLWFLLFVLAPLATLAGYGSTYGIGSAGGGVTVGNAVSGGTASRLLFNDASGLVSTATPALGAALTLTGALSGTSSNWTGQAVFSGVTTDISTGTNEDLTITPNGTGIVNVTTAATIGGRLTLAGDLISTNSSACFTGLPISALCINEQYIVNNFNGSSAFVARIGSTSDASGFQIYNSASTPVFMGGVRYFGSTASASKYQNRVVLYSTGGADGVVIGENTTDRAAGTVVARVVDGAGGANDLMTVDGVGAIRIPANTAAHGTTCNSGSEGTFYYRTIAASNKSGMCMCAQTSSGVYGWKMWQTFGSSALTDGDC